MRSMVVLTALLLVIAIGSSVECVAQSPVPLPAYNVDPSQASVSGFGSGGSMAMQLGIAYSSRIMGVGALVGRPYDCYRSGNVPPRDCEGLNTPDISGLLANMNRWSGHEIDAVANIAGQEIYVYAGADDFTRPAGTLPLYRLYNNGQGAAPNHRYTTSSAIRSAMIGQGWIPEGSGIGVVACVPN